MMTEGGIKGVCLRSVHHLLEEEGRLESVLQALSPADRDELAPPALANRWYSLAAYARMLDKLIEVDGGDPKTVCQRVGRRVIRDGLSTVYRSFLRVGRPSWAIRGAHLLWGSYFHGSELQVIEARRGFASGRVTGAAATTRALCLTEVGGIAGAIELAGGRDVQVEHPHCRVDGHPECVFELRWQEGPGQS